MRWTLGWNKIVDDWNELWPELVPLLGSRRGFGLFKDGIGHLALGAAVGFLWTYVTGASIGGTIVFAVGVGFGREVWQIMSDSSPKSNTLDRIKDTLETGVGGALIGLIL